MPKAKEELLFKLIHRTGEYQQGQYQIFTLDDEHGLRYRVDCGKKGSFEIARVERAEEFKPEVDDWKWESDTWYLFDGNQSDNLPVIDIDVALEIIGVLLSPPRRR